MSGNVNRANVQFILTLTGPWAANQQTTVSYTQLGNMITLHFTEVRAAGVNGTTITNTGGTVIPERLRPIADTIILVNIYRDLTGNMGAIKLFTNGNIDISVNGDNSTFPITPGAQSGFKAFAINYIATPVEGWDYQ